MDNFVLQNNNCPLKNTSHGNLRYIFNYLKINFEEEKKFLHF